MIHYYSILHIICLSLTLWLHIYISTYLSLDLSIYLTNQTISLSLWCFLSLSLSIYLSRSLSLTLSLCLSHSFSLSLIHATGMKALALQSKEAGRSNVAFLAFFVTGQVWRTCLHLHRLHIKPQNFILSSFCLAFFPPSHGLMMVSY